MARQKQPDVSSETETLEAAGRAINLLVWMVAAVVMVFSAITGAELLAAHGVDKRLGLAGGLAVDAALVVALIGDRQLHRYGQSAPWGTVLRWVTALFSLVLNCGQSYSNGDWGAVGLHAIFPVLLIVLTEASQGYQLAFGRAVLKARDTTEYRTQAVPGTAPAPVPKPAGAKPVGTSESKPRERKGSRGKALSDKPAVKPRTKAAGEWDDELWSRAWNLTARYQREHGRDPKLGEFHSELRMSRNAASPLRNAVLAALAAHGSEPEESGADSTQVGTDSEFSDIDSGTRARVVQLHTADTAEPDTDQTADAR